MTIVRRQRLSRVEREPKNPRSRMLVRGLRVQQLVDREGRQGLGGRTWRDSVQRVGGMYLVNAAEALVWSIDALSEVVVGLDRSM